MCGRRFLIAGACALAALASPTVAQAAELFGVVGPGFTISLRDDRGRPVTQLAPGSYTITVDDRSEFHNFRLSGPGVNVATDVDSVHTVVWEVTLVDGVYTFLCDPHRREMRGTLTVGTARPPPAAPPRRLVGTVGARAISLTLNGRRVTALAAGRYVIVVRDRSRKHNFHLRGPGVNRRTAVARTGTFTWRVTLRRGTYRFLSDPQLRRLRGSFRVR